MSPVSSVSQRIAASLSRLGSPTEQLAIFQQGGASLEDERPHVLPARLAGDDLGVPLVTGNAVRYVNLDYASSAPCLESVRSAVDRLLPWYGSVHRGAGFVSTVMSESYAAARAAVGAFVGARGDDAILFTRNTTDALNLLASALPEDTAVLTFASEHHANLLPWRRRARCTHLPVPASPDHALSLVEEALRREPAPHRLLAVTGASNVTGELWPIAELAEIAHRHGARVAVDAAQLAPHRAIAMAEAGIDYLALSGHKLYAPFGAGALVGCRDWLDAAEPYLAGGGAVEHVGLESVEWAHGAARHEGGTPNAVGAIALGAACTALAEIGMVDVARHEASLLARVTRGLRDLAGAEVLSMWGPGSARIGVVTFNVRGWHHGALAAALNAEYGIGLREGAFCAHPLVEELTARSAPETDARSRGAVRASFGVGTREADIERLLCALDSLIRHGARWSYRVEHGRLVPDPDPRPRPSFLPYATPRVIASSCR